MRKTVVLNRTFRQGSLKFRIFVFGFSILILCGCEELFQTPKSAGSAQYLPRAIEIIRLSLQDSDSRVRVKAIEVVADTGREEFMPEVERLLGDDYVPVRFAAAMAVGDTGYRQGESRVRRLLKAPDENTKIAAAYALMKLGSAENFDVLLEALKSKDQTIRANAATLLGKSGDETALKPLYWAMKDEGSEDKVRFAAAEAIARLGDERIFERLWAVVLSGYADDRIIGIRSMGLLGTRKAKDVLITKLDDEVLEVRLAAAEQLGMLGNTSGQVEVLEVFTKNLTGGLSGQDLERVNVLTALAIGQISSDRLVSYLPRFLADESKFVRLAAAKAVLLCGRKR